MGLSPEQFQRRIEDGLVEIKRLDAENARLRDALEECLEWFQERADGEYVLSRIVGNPEMKMAGMVEEALCRSGRYGL